MDDEENILSQYNDTGGLYNRSHRATNEIKFVYKLRRQKTFGKIRFIRKAQGWEDILIVWSKTMNSKCERLIDRNFDKT